MLQPVAVGHKTLADSSSIVARGLVEEIRELAEPLRGQRVAHLCQVSRFDPRKDPRGAIEVQSHADVLIQKSTREGFGLTVSEAIWKARPFIGGDVGGIPLQVQDGVTGYLVGNVEECAARAAAILRDPGLGRSLGLAGKEHIRKHSLMPRLLHDWLKIFNELEG